MTPLKQSKLIMVTQFLEKNLAAPEKFKFSNQNILTLRHVQSRIILNLCMNLVQLKNLK